MDIMWWVVIGILWCGIGASASTIGILRKNTREKKKMDGFDWISGLLMIFPGPITLIAVLIVEVLVRWLERRYTPE